MATQDAFNPGRETAPVTASPNIQAVQARYDPNASANSLLAALGAESTQKSIAGFQEAYEQKKLQDQSVKIEGFIQQYENDGTSGAVSQAQLKQRFPEMVPVIAARVAEAIGRKQGALGIRGAVEKINNDDGLRLDTAKRTAYVANARKELFDAIPQGNEFYAAGVVQAMDRAFNEQELKWQGQTAAYHQQVQKDGLLDEAVTALMSTDPKAAMLALDGRYEVSSSVHKIERNPIYVEAVIKTAVVSDDIKVLDRIPQAYLNASSKEKIFKARVAITNQQVAQYGHAKDFAASQRAEALRNTKLEILQTTGRGAMPDLSKYLDSPEAHAYAVEALSTPRYPEAASKAAVQAFRSSLVDASHTMTLGTQAGITEALMKVRGINPKDMADAVAEVPKWMEGTVLMNTPVIQETFRNEIGFRLDVLAKSTNSLIANLLGEGNLQGKMRTMFESEIRSEAEAHYSVHRVWPQAIEMRTIVKAAAASVSARIDYLVRPGASTNDAAGNGGKASTPKASAPKAASRTSVGKVSETPAAPLQLPKGVSLATP